MLFYAYDESGNRISASDGVTSGGVAVNTTRYRYDTQGRIVAAMTPLATSYTSPYKTLYTYDQQGHQTSVTDGNGNSQSWTYDTFGRLLSHTDLGGRLIKTVYDAWGRVSRQYDSASDAAGHSTGQDQRYSYADNGWLAGITEVLPNADTRSTVYRYDLAGNRILERYGDGVQYQDTRITYDALNRVVQVRDSRYAIATAYDAAGNRIHTYTQYVADPAQPNTGTTATPLDYWYQYDAMNRLTLAEGSLVGGQVVRDDGTAIAYDLGGARRMVTGGTAAGPYYTLYTYDSAGRLVETSGGATPDGGAPADLRYYDQAGRLTSYSSYDTSGSHAASGPSLVTQRKMYYNQNGWLITENDSKSNYDSSGNPLATNTQRVRYSSSTASDSDTPSIATDAGYYDAAGNATQYTDHIVDNLNSIAYTNTYTLSYARYNSYRQQSETAAPDPNRPGYVPASSIQTFDVYGNAVGVVQTYGSAPIRSTLVDAQGRILTQSLYASGNVLQGKQNYYYLNDNPVGNAGNLEAALYDAVLVDAGHPASNAPLADMADFNGIQDQVGPQAPSGINQYVVQPQDVTLSGIAAAVWGDSSQWYLIADANGLASNTDLTPGQTLTIPQRSGTIHSSSDTVVPYDPAKVMGDISAQPHYIPPHIICGSFAPILTTLVSVVVFALVFEIPGAGPYLAPLASNVAGQIVGSALGLQSGVDMIKAYKIGAIGAATAGAGQLLAGSDVATETAQEANGAAQAAQAADEAVQTAEAAGQVASEATQVSTTAQQLQAIAATAHSAAEDAALIARTVTVGIGVAQNAVSQGLSVALGVQGHFSWSQLAGAAVGSAFDAFLGTRPSASGQGVESAGTGGTSLADLPGDFGRQLLRGTAVRATELLLGGQGSFDFANIAADAFGNTLGNYVGRQIGESYRQAQRVGAQAAAQLQPLPAYEQPKFLEMLEPSPQFPDFATPPDWGLAPASQSDGSSTRGSGTSRSPATTAAQQPQQGNQGFASFAQLRAAHRLDPSYYRGTNGGGSFSLTLGGGLLAAKTLPRWVPEFGGPLLESAGLLGLAYIGLDLSWDAFKDFVAHDNTGNIYAKSAMRADFNLTPAGSGPLFPVKDGFTPVDVTGSNILINDPPPAPLPLPGLTPPYFPIDPTSAGGYQPQDVSDWLGPIGFPDGSQSPSDWRLPGFGEGVSVQTPLANARASESGYQVLRTGRAGNRVVQGTDGSIYNLPPGVTVDQIPASDPIGDKLQQLASQGKGLLQSGAITVTLAQQRAIDNAKATGEYGTAAWYKNMYEGTAVENYVEQQAANDSALQGLSFNHTGVDVTVKNQDISYELGAGSSSNLFDHARRMSDTFFRWIGF